METAAREFQIMVKTIGAICNLDCHYCYYLDKENLYPKGTNFRLDDETLERYIVQHIQATPKETVSFSWHGGEPTLLGVDFFRKAVTLQKKHLPLDKKIINGIQTNGTTIDDEWCEFLAKENFYIGLSLDGPRELHDHYRVTKGQKPTHKQVVQAFHMLRRAKVHVDLLTVVHDVNVKHPTQVYRYLKEIGGQYLQFLPLVEKTGDPANPVHKRSVPAAAYGTFLNTIFDEWVRHDIGKIFIQLFDESVRPFLGMEHALCIYRETCGDVPVVEHNGDFYSCDHYVTPEYKIGNIHDRAARGHGRRSETARVRPDQVDQPAEVLPRVRSVEHVQRRLSQGPDHQDAVRRRRAQLSLRRPQVILRPQQAVFSKIRRAGRGRRADRKVDGDRSRRGRKSFRPPSRTKRSLPVRQRQEVQALLRRRPRRSVVQSCSCDVLVVRRTRFTITPTFLRAPYGKFFP